MIRPAEPADAPAVAALYATLTSEMAVLAPQAYRALSVGRTGYFRDYIEAAGSDVLLAIDPNTQQPVGFALIIAAATEPTAELIAQHFALLVDLFVQEESRHQGHGEALLAAATAWTKREGLPEMRLNVLADNEPARAFYARNGFTEQLLTLSRPVD